MNTVAEIEEALRALSVDEARAVSDWLQEYLEEQWNLQIQRDVAAGTLDKLAAQALEHYKAGRVKPLDELLHNP